MASAIKCDKCGMTSSKMADFIHVRAYTLSDATSYNTAALEHFDLCTKCYDEIFNFKKESEEE